MEEDATIEIVEVIRRTQQGVTQPYICRSEGGDLHFVKGKGAGYASLAKEWVAGSLGRRLGLPIPDFTILNVPLALYRLGHPGWLTALGPGEVFGSKAVEGADEITMVEVAAIPNAVKQQIAVFDWWILNGDRTLSDNGGNPNILWRARNDGPFVIDHNLAFDETVTLSSLERDHVFGEALTEVVDTAALRDAFAELLYDCLADWDDIWLQLPERWCFLDDRRTMETDFIEARAIALLRRCETADMWSRQ